jgi:hypothetical protein
LGATMRIKVLAFAASLLLISNTSVGIPQTPTTITSAPMRDAQAVALLQQSVSVLGVPPSDSTATGSVTTIAGSLTQQGTVTILTRGSAQTSIQFQMPTNPWTVVFASGQASKIETTQTTVYPLERAASSQCLYFPLPFLSSILNNADYSVQYIGQEIVGTSTANHIVVQNTFNSTPTYKFLSPFAAADIWIDAASGLPVKIGMIRRDGGGSAPKIPISVVYSNYQNVSGVRYPFTIQEHITETLWATTTIQSVTFNSGLTDSNFQVATGGN